MLSSQQSFSPTNRNYVTVTKKDQLFSTLKQLRFNGQLVWRDANKQEWIFFFNRGHIVYATGGTHPVRRWQRNLAAHCPGTACQITIGQSQELDAESKQLDSCWEYQQLELWVAQQKITRSQVAKMITSLICELLFDLVSINDLTNQIKHDEPLSKQLVLIDPEEVFSQAKQVWQVWNQAKLSNYSPNLAPVIRQPEQLKNVTSAQVYPTLNTLFNGRNTLRDLGVRMKRDSVQVARSLLPYLELGLVELIPIPDLSIPVNRSVPKTPAKSAARQEPLIACVDDSILVCQTMKRLLTKTGYQFLGIDDPLRAIALLLARKPNFIFLDLVMPNTNGYEICTQLRKISCFEQTPIVMLTGQDGLVDQVRARLVGASDFVSKPIDPEIVLRVINKHLEPISAY